MKTKYLFFFILITLLSCKGMLELQPTDSISAEEAIENESDLVNAIYGCYDALQSEDYYGRLYIAITEIGSDNAYNGGTIFEYDQFNKNNVQKDNTYLENLWAAPYIAINRCNTAIYYTNLLEGLVAEKKNEYLAELRFLRALNYYNLSRFFKDIPLKLEPTFSEEDLNVPLSEQSVIYTQILDDLSFANDKISKTDPFFATDLAVKTLLAKVNLELKNYREAIVYADLVISSNKELLDNYENLFIIEGNSETIFELSFTELISDKNRLAEYCFPSNLGGRYEIAPDNSLLDSYEENDTRRNLFKGTTPYCNKYENITSGEDNVCVFRLAELYLLRAEARARSKGNLSLIRKDINTIRNRAGLTSTYISSYNELLQIIEDERRHEFAFEGHRWFDLVRTDRASEVLNISKNKYYFPIPLSEINTNTEIN